MNFFSKLKEQSSQFILKVQSSITNVLSEQNEYLEEQKLENLKEKNARLPWENLRSLGSSSNGSFGEKVREEISELAKNPNNFLIEEDNYMYTFEFSLDEKKYIAQKILEQDRTLAIVRGKLVPKRISDEKFWKNYFYNVEVIKMKYNMKNEIQDLQDKKTEGEQSEDLRQNQYEQEKQEEFIEDEQEKLFKEEKLTQKNKVILEKEKLIKFEEQKNAEITEKSQENSLLDLEENTEHKEENSDQQEKVEFKGIDNLDLGREKEKEAENGDFIQL